MTDRATRARADRLPRAERLRQLLAPAAVFLALLAVISVAVPTFLLGAGPAIIAQQATPILLLALGQCLVLTIGSIDLSNGAMALFCSILTALLLGPLGAAAPVLCVGITTMIGAANGLMLVAGQVPSFALTLGTLGILQAASLIVTGSNVIYVTANYNRIDWLFLTQVLGMPVAFWIALALAFVLWAFVRLTTWGQGLMAVGFNERAAALSALPVKGLKVAAFAISGFFAGLAGVAVISIAGAASSTGLGSDLLVPAIAAALVGGTAITGGTCNPINVVFGAMFIALIPVATNALGVSPLAQSIVYGLVLVVAVAATMSRDRSGIAK